MKNKAAVALGRLGGLKGGKARAEALSPERRKEIAKKAIAARWAKVKEAPKGQAYSSSSYCCSASLSACARDSFLL
jgi:hypothetical protein